MEVLSDKVTDRRKLDKWISKKISTLEFDCEDFPHDLDSFYDCYFRSNDEEQYAYRIYCLLKQKLQDINQVVFSVSIVDESMNIIKRNLFYDGLEMKWENK